jgi:hypothetical protein
MTFGRQTFGYFISRRLVASEEDQPPECAPTLSIVTRDWPKGDRKPPRWQGPPIVRVYREPSHAVLAEISD